MPQLAAPVASAAASRWSVEDQPNDAGPGRIAVMRYDGKPAAAFVYGEGQIKPFLHLYGVHGEFLTNGGLDASGRTRGVFPHHRGLFIGWKIDSELGGWDLWHMTRGARIEVTEIEAMEANDERCALAVRAVWRAGRADADGSDRLIEERRRVEMSRGSDGGLNVDFTFDLRPERDLRLAGDLQHSGVHFRAALEVNERKSETSYLQEPAGAVKSSDLKWCRLLFPIGNQWYAVQAMNHPANPVEELSMRDYGRFGYFFKRALKREEALTLRYRFRLDPVPAPAAGSRLSEEQAAAARRAADEYYREYVQSHQVTAKH